jgi:hypothetical protein
MLAHGPFGKETEFAPGTFPSLARWHVSSCPSVLRLPMSYLALPVYTRSGGERTDGRVVPRPSSPSLERMEALSPVEVVVVIVGPVTPSPSLQARLEPCPFELAARPSCALFRASTTSTAMDLTGALSSFVYPIPHTSCFLNPIRR